jgi:hypothetical protein
MTVLALTGSRKREKRGLDQVKLPCRAIPLNVGNRRAKRISKFTKTRSAEPTVEGKPRLTGNCCVLFNLPAQIRELEEGVPTTENLGNGAKQGKNDFGKIGYGGPAPPKGKPHRYFFKLYALNVAMDLKPGATKAQLMEAMKDHLLAEGQLMGKYGR